ncbi:hypothetical protein QP282_21595 [Escherichia coli]|jgi:transcriptional regulator with XRE-family HTH domain|uniref:hypothetical protein n=1 Tax=Escherichia coli TaxID=562 RepID=UPI0009852731|nr:hypothetical protein [Escherichia coli]EGN1100488.1 hypothetical protein [Escherichia coli]EGX7852505.1 hypothetical protein [Escherichia coli]MCN2141472.1 hypothetical protein [Escherichia coli]MCO0533994.1 hypothetical protein [Escherichia coli]MCX9162111.1 hypothetical protein [Escherichia coli]
MENNKLSLAEVSESMNSAISYNNSAIEIANLWFQLLSNNERDESTARLIFAISELLDISTSKINKALEKIHELKHHTNGI